MAQTQFFLSDEGRNITVLNDSGTTAIFAGDLVFATGNDDVLTGTAASARNAYAGGDIKVFGNDTNSTGYKTCIGVASEDIPADGYGNVAMEGVFIAPVSADTEAGDILKGVASSNSVVGIADYAYGSTTTAVGLVNDFKYKIGKALTGGSTSGKYIVWKLNI